jgi:hypothetical protein
MKHVEMYDGRVFCGFNSYQYDGVHQSDWHDSPTALAKATCRKCLSVIFTLGCWAQNALGPEEIPPGASCNPPAPRKP